MHWSLTLRLVFAVNLLHLLAGAKLWDGLPVVLEDCLNSFGVSTITESSPEYESLRFSFNHRVDVRPKAIVFPDSALSVSHAVVCARASGISFSARSGKHSYEGYGVQADALLIDMSKMKTVAKTDDLASEVWLDSGLTLGEVYYYLSLWGKTLPGGTCGSVGLGGHSLGGGFGVRSRLYGLMVDHIIAVEIVSVDGEILIADANSHPDLFWALLGAGQGEFGVVTRMRFQTVPALPVIEFVYTYQVTSAAAAVRFLQGFVTHPKAQNELWMAMSLVRSRDSVVISGYYIGTRRKFDKVINDIGLHTSMGQPSSTAINRLEYIQSILSAANLPITDPPTNLLTYEFMPSDRNWKARSGFVQQQIPADQIDAFIASFYDTSVPAFNIWDAYILIDSWRGNIQDPTKVDRSAFAHRSALLSVQSWVSWNTGDPIEQPMRDWQNRVWGVLSPNLSGAYVNYADADLVDYMNAYYPGNVAKLVEVKTLYDPDNVMHYGQSIPIVSHPSV